MVKPRKMYDKEFKLMAVELIESHKTVAEVSNNWIKYIYNANKQG